MKLLVNRRIRVIPDVITYISRQLPGSGKITVSVGRQVTPEDIIGHSEVSAGFRNINLADMLACSPKDGKKYLQRNLGQTIYKGELLAFKQGGVFGSKKVVISPTDGRIESYDENKGELHLSFLPRSKDLAAAVYGIVERVDNLKGEVIIKTQVTQIYGLFGSGKNREGILHILGQRGDLLSKTVLHDDLAEHIVVGGALVYSDALSQAIAKRVLGIVTGGINAEDFRSISGGRLTNPKKFGTDIGIGILVCEGFGSIPIGEDIFDALREFNGRFAILEGNRGRLLLPTCEADCMRIITKVQLPNPEISSVAPLSEVEAQELKIGNKIRIIGNQYMGEQGIVLAIDNQPSRLPSGIVVSLITIQTQTRKLRVPYTNVEIIG